MVAAGSPQGVTSDDWCTPLWLTSLLGAFDVDPCSNASSHVRANLRIARPQNGLTSQWPGSVFCNPPYSNVGPWAEKLVAHDGPWVALLKLDPTTRWWATLMQANPVVAPFRKRIKFEGAQSMTANFPSVLVWRDWHPSSELEQHLWVRRY